MGFICANGLIVGESAMSDLKTLKELKLSSKNPMFNMGADDQREVIRQGVIADSKLFTKLKNSVGFQATMAFDHGVTNIEGAIGYMNWKFNISKEDLK